MTSRRRAKRTRPGKEEGGVPPEKSPPSKAMRGQEEGGEQGEDKEAKGANLRKFLPSSTVQKLGHVFRTEHKAMLGCSR